jgi:hypothetical protein
MRFRLGLYVSAPEGIVRNLLIATGRRSTEMGSVSGGIRRFAPRRARAPAACATLIAEVDYADHGFASGLPGSREPCALPLWFLSR